MDIIVAEHIFPNLGIGSLQEVAGLRPEHGILVRNIDQLEIIATFAVGNEGEIGIALLAVFTNGEGIILVVLFQELAGVIVTVFEDVSEMIRTRNASFYRCRSLRERCTQPAAGCQPPKSARGTEARASGDCATRLRRRDHRLE